MSAVPVSNFNIFVAVIIPCYRVAEHILEVIAGIGPEVSVVYIVDDCCPEGSGDIVLKMVHDRRVQVQRLAMNSGVGGATKAGYKKALEAGAEIIVKMDGDAQMDARMIPQLLQPFLQSDVAYVKGNRFYTWKVALKMPTVRLVGNFVLSLFSRISSGYWGVRDSTNGFTAIRSEVVRRIPLDMIDDDYFFESDMLYWLHTLGESVTEIPMEACYGNERSNLNILRCIPLFFLKHLRNFFRRLFVSCQ